MADSALKDSNESNESNFVFRDEKTPQKNAVNNRSVKLSESISTSSSSDDSSSESSDVWFSDAFALPPAPDGGWGWFVVLGAFFISMICDGCAFSFGVMFVYLLEEFQQSKSETAWVASIFYCLSLLLGPVASTLTTRYGCRKVTMVAGVMCCTGFLASSFVTSVWMLYLTFGVIVGAGFSVCYVTSVVSVAYYFEKRRALATGLSVCGTGIGTFMFAPLCEYLVGIYGWRGTFLIMGAISLNITVCGALFRPLKFTPEQRRQRALDAFNRLSRTVSRLSIPSRNRSRLHSTNSESSSTSDSDSEVDPALLAISQITLPTYIKNDEEKIKMYLEMLPELRKVTADPQVVMQRFFKSKNLRHAGKKSPSKAQAPNQAKSETNAGNKSPENSAKRHENGKDSTLNELNETTEMIEEGEPKKKKRKKNAEKKAAEEVTIENKALSDETMQQLKEKLLESAREPPVRHHKSRSESRLAQVAVKDPDAHRLERSASERTPKEMHVKPKGTPAAVKTEPGVPPSQSGNMSSGGDVGIMLMNKHSTYLLLHRNDIFFRGSRFNALGYVATSCPELSRLPSDSESDSDEECCDCEERCPCMEGCIESVRKSCDKKMARHPLFLLFAVSNFLLYFWSDVPYVFASDFAQSRGVDDSSATFLISVIGIVNTFGQVFYGFIGDRDWNLTIIYGISCIGSGLAVLLLPTANAYWLMAVLCGLFGFFVSANYSLMTVMLVSYLGLNKLVHAYGLIMMIQGIANLGGPPVAGWLVDSTGHYGVAFPVAGGFIILSGMILFLLYVGRLCSRLCQGCHRRQKRRPNPSASDKQSPAKSKNNNAWIGGPPSNGQDVV